MKVEGSAEALGLLETLNIIYTILTRVTFFYFLICFHHLVTGPFLKQFAWFVYLLVLIWFLFCFRACLFICVTVSCFFYFCSLSCLPAYVFICLLIYNIIPILNCKFWFYRSIRCSVSFPLVVTRTQLHLLSSLWQLLVQSHTSVLFFNRTWNSSRPSHQTGKHSFDFSSYPSVSLS